jgi:hypothetical protein
MFASPLTGSPIAHQTLVSKHRHQRIMPSSLSSRTDISSSFLPSFLTRRPFRCRHLPLSPRSVYFLPADASIYGSLCWSFSEPPASQTRFGMPWERGNTIALHQNSSQNSCAPKQHQLQNFSLGECWAVFWPSSSRYFQFNRAILCRLHSILSFALSFVSGDCQPRLGFDIFVWRFSECR